MRKNNLISLLFLLISFPFFCLGQIIDFNRIFMIVDNNYALSIIIFKLTTWTRP